jgi:hypothetical protein
VAREVARCAQEKTSELLSCACACYWESTTTMFMCVLDCVMAAVVVVVVVLPVVVVVDWGWW